MYSILNDHYLVWTEDSSCLVTLSPPRAPVMGGGTGEGGGREGGKGEIREPGMTFMNAY